MFFLNYGISHILVRMVTFVNNDPYTMSNIYTMQLNYSIFIFCFANA